MIDQWWAWAWALAADPAVQATAGSMLVGAFVLAVILNKS